MSVFRQVLIPAIFIALLLLVAVGKHAVDTDFWQHPSTDELDILK